MVFILRPLNFHKSDAAFYARRRAGALLSSHDVFEMEYGHFPPRGVSPDAQNANTVTIKNTWQNERLSLGKKILTSLGAAAYVRRYRLDETPDEESTKKNRIIFLNNLFFSSGGQLLTAGLSALLAFNAAAALATGTLDPAIALPALLCASSLRTQFFTSLGSYIFDPVMNTVGHEHIHILQMRDKFEAQTGYNIFQNAFQNKTLERQNPFLSRLDTIASGGFIKNLMKDCEIQARLHLVLVRGYKRWGRLPETKKELWAALIDSGLIAPKSIQEEVAADASPSLKDFLEQGLKASFNRHARRITRLETAELNAAYRGHIHANLKEEYWRETLPFIYGHLIELYGDKDGRRRMGIEGTKMDTNTTPSAQSSPAPG